MSLATWKEEFYPVRACDVPKKDAVAHSLQKWIGLRKKNLDKHGCRLSIGWNAQLIDDINPGMFAIDNRSCALCHHYLDSEDEAGGCAFCPLKKLLGVPCDADGQPYRVFCKTNDPEPMIAALEKALSLQEKPAEANS